MLAMANIHCEIAGDIANTLGLSPETEAALRAIFEAYDGGGVPGLLQGNDVPLATCVVALASDLEIFSRLYGLDEALALARGRANSVYPAFLVDATAPRLPSGWRCSTRPSRRGPTWPTSPVSMRRRVGLELVGDVIDLKLPWMTGYSRRVAQAGARLQRAHARHGRALRHRTYKAGLIHGIGRAAVPNAIWNAPEPLPASSLERLRLVPYWTSRAAGQIDGLAAEAEIASFAFERRDGSGYFRGRSGMAMPLEGQIVAAAEQWVSHRTRRPWREALSEAQRCDRMQQDVGRAASTRRSSPRCSPAPCRRAHARSPHSAPPQARGARRHSRFVAARAGGAALHQPGRQHQAGRSRAEHQSEHGANACRTRVPQARLLDDTGSPRSSGPVGATSSGVIVLAGVSRPGVDVAQPFDVVQVLLARQQRAGAHVRVSKVPAWAGASFLVSRQPATSSSITHAGMRCRSPG
jgi:hypothetical protein